MKTYFEVIFYTYYNEDKTNFDIESFGPYKTLHQARLAAKKIRNAQYISEYNEQELVGNHKL